MRLVFDVETNALENPDKIWCIVCHDLDSNDSMDFTDPAGFRLFKELVDQADEIIGHNIIAYDLPVLRDLCGITVHPSRVTDTLILSHLLAYTMDNGHSLEAWGERLGYPKVGIGIDFQNYSPEILERCKQDVIINTKTYKFLEHKLKGEQWAEAIDAEHKMAWICQDMTETGFSFDFDTASALFNEIKEKTDKLDVELQTAFPPKLVPIREITPKLTKHGTISKSNLPRSWTDLSSLQAESPFVLCDIVHFNPSSPKQIVERLNAAGWQPTEKTKGHETCTDPAKLSEYATYGWKVNERNLATLPDTAPEAAHSLVERIMLGARLRTLEEWFKAYDRNDGRVHGRFNTIGTWTHRMSHRAPNMGNIAARKSIKYVGERLSSMALDLGTRMRKLWGVPANHWLVGTDADQIQLRIFAHYVNDNELVEALHTGVKEEGTDVHSLNASKLGISRDQAKTFIYAFLLGAGAAKLGEIVGGSAARGAELREQFIEAYPGYASLRATDIPRDAKRRYFRGFDGRLVICDSEHLVLAGYLQNGEACIMKHANIEWRQYAIEKGINFKQVNFVHDEWQTEVIGSQEIAEELGRIQCRAIEKAGEKFHLRCPLRGETKIGKTWLDTH